jgi:phospholipid/cholesterol/gamma-HCH transport system ATP-binding protein
MSAASSPVVMSVDPATFGALQTALAAVFARDTAEVRRLAYADTRVALRLAGDEQTIVMLLDRRPCEVALGAPADVELVLTPALARRFLAGELSMSRAVVTGAIPAAGPVRRYLEVDPILRQVLRLVGGAGAAPELRPPEAAPARPAGTIDPELLAIETRDLHKSFGDHRVLRGLEVRIPEGLISIVLGPSGTGKSVLLQHVIGLLMPERGDVLIRGRSLGTMDRAELLELRTEIGVMFQDGALFSAMTVYDNVAFPLRQHTDMVEAEIREVVMDHLASVGLAAARDLMPNELSGGMRKRAGMARALVMNPGILLCDEPDSGLDPVRTALLGQLLIEQHALYGGTIVVVTHNVLLARQIGEHISVVWHGKVLESGMADAILESGSEFVRQFLSGSSQGPLGMDA